MAVILKPDDDVEVTRDELNLYSYNYHLRYGPAPVTPPAPTLEQYIRTIRWGLLNDSLRKSTDWKHLT